MRARDGLCAGGRWLRTVDPAHRIPRSLSRKGEMPKGRTCVDLLHGLIFPTVVIKQHRRQPSRACWRAEQLTSLELPRDAMGRAARKWQLRRCVYCDLRRPPIIRVLPIAGYPHLNYFKTDFFNGIAHSGHTGRPTP